MVVGIMLVIAVLWSLALILQPQAYEWIYPQPDPGRAEINRLICGRPAHWDI